jgi:hypothetical protein
LTSEGEKNANIIYPQGFKDQKRKPVNTDGPGRLLPPNADKAFESIHIEKTNAAEDVKGLVTGVFISGDHSPEFPAGGVSRQDGAVVQGSWNGPLAGKDKVWSCHESDCATKLTAKVTAKGGDVFKVYRLPIIYKCGDDGELVTFIDCWMVNPNKGQGQTKGPTRENMQWGAAGVADPDPRACAKELQNFRGALATASGSNADFGKRQAARLAFIQNVLAIVEPLVSSTSFALAIDKSQRTPLFEADSDGVTELDKIGQDGKAIADAVQKTVLGAEDIDGNKRVSEETAEKTELGVSLAIKTAGCGIGIATAIFTVGAGAPAAAIACGPLLVQGVSEVVTYMQNRVQFAPKEPAFLYSLEWTKSYMEELQTVETRVADAMKRKDPKCEQGPKKKMRSSAVQVHSGDALLDAQNYVPHRRDDQVLGFVEAHVLCGEE